MLCSSELGIQINERKKMKEKKKKSENLNEKDNEDMKYLFPSWKIKKDSNNKQKNKVVVLL